MFKRVCLFLAASAAIPASTSACVVALKGRDASFQTELTGEMRDMPIVAEVRILEITEEYTPLLDFSWQAKLVQTVVVQGIQGVENGDFLTVAWLDYPCRFFFDYPRLDRTYFVAGRELGGWIWGEWPNDELEPGLFLNDFIWRNAQRMLDQQVSE